MMRQQFTIPQQFIVGDIKIDTKAQLGRKYTRLLIDAFVPYQEAMLAYLDELIAKHDPQLVERQLGEVQKQNRKKSNEWEQTVCPVPDIINTATRRGIGSAQYWLR